MATDTNGGRKATINVSWLLTIDRHRENINVTPGTSRNTSELHLQRGAVTTTARNSNFSNMLGTIRTFNQFCCNNLKRTQRLYSNLTNLSKFIINGPSVLVLLNLKANITFDAIHVVDERKSRRAKSPAWIDMTVPLFYFTLIVFNPKGSLRFVPCA